VVQALVEFGFPVNEHAVHQRVVYAESAARGLGVIEHEPRSEAAREIACLAKSLLGRQAKAKAA
jgi:chromosome partitioning protein